MLAKDIMSRDVITVRKDSTIKEVVELLVEHKISGAPVVDETDRLIGMISEGDLLYKDRKLQTPAFLEILGGVIYLENPQRLSQDLKKMTASVVTELMTKKVFTVREITPVQEIASLMIKRKINRVPVVDEAEKVVGIVSRQDLVRSIA